VPAGSYRLLFDVVGANGGSRIAADQNVTLADDAPQTLTTSVTGPVGVPQARLTGGISAAGLPVSGPATVSFQPVGGGLAITGRRLNPPANGISVELPAGSYTATVEAPDADAIGTSFPVALSAGQVAQQDVVLPALAIPPGIHSTATDADLVSLNSERARWGIPAGLIANQTWSDACAAHNAYEQTNHVLDHPETQAAPGFSPGGNWAGTHSVLSDKSPWTATVNPWDDAPIHLNQLMTPDLSVIGIDASRGHVCATTFPGMLAPVAASGTVFTYPGDGTTGLPPAENAQERPFVPGQFVGIPEGTIAGRELFVYEEGNAGSFSHGVSIANATLTGPSGPVEIRWVDSTTNQVGPFLTGGVILPVKPLAPKTTYTAQVVLNAFGGTFDSVIPAVSHQWSFSTGATNPTGAWPGGPNDPTSTATAKAPRISGLRMSNRRFRVVGHRASSRKARAPMGTKIRFNLSAQATVTIGIAPQSGLLRGKRCVSASARLRRAHAKRCSPVRQIGHLTRGNVRAGATRLNFSGNLGRRSLAPGRYRATLTAQNAKGNSRPATVRFQIVR
jgi:hypothetical protein